MLLHFVRIRYEIEVLYISDDSIVYFQKKLKVI